MPKKRIRRIATRRMRPQYGAEIPQFAAAIILIIPIFIALVYMTYEACIYMYLKTGVDAAARTEARWLAINFNYFVQENGGGTGNYATWKNSNVRVPLCVNSNLQFTNGTINAAGQFVTTPPPVVSAGGCLPSASGQGSLAVQVTYPGGSGLPPWPNPPIYLFGMNLTPDDITIQSVYVADIEP